MRLLVRVIYIRSWYKKDVEFVFRTKLGCREINDSENRWEEFSHHVKTKIQYIKVRTWRRRLVKRDDKIV